MDYLGKKLNTFTNDALSGISELQRKRQDGKGTNSSAEHSQLQTVPSGTNFMQAPHENPMAAGMPFGGDTTLPAPPIGFKYDNLIRVPQNRLTALPSPSSSSQPPPQQQPSQSQMDQTESTQSLYEGDTWTRLWFQRVMLLSLVRLLLFIRKVYEDFHATKVYNATGHTSQMLVAAISLFLPTVVFTLYRVSRYLQIVLPPLRAINLAKQEAESSQAPVAVGTLATSNSSRADEEDDDQLRRALMSSPSVTSGPQSFSPSSPISGIAAGITATDEDEGLVTARQTPVNMQSGTIVDTAISSATTDPVVNRVQREATGKIRRPENQPTESVKIDKLGNLPDKHTTRVVIGASEQLLHGVLFVFWQLKRQVDVLGYLVERACLWRKPSEVEKQQVGRMRTGSDGLEWFQDFYAAFLAILAQIYTLTAHWLDEGDAVIHRLKPTSISAATGALETGSSSGGTGGDLTTRLISNTLGQQVLAGGNSATNGKDLIILSELVVSSAVVVSLLIAVRRRDDGPLTLGLSMLGWAAIFSSRILIISLAFVHLGWKLTLTLVALHVLGITGWIYKIALDSHNDKPCEREMEAKWDSEAEIGPAQPASAGVEMSETTTRTSQALSSGRPKPTIGEDDIGNTGHPSGKSATSSWTVIEHVILIAQILNLFAIPSLFYWPIMFNLKFHLRPYKYLVLMLTQNFLLIPAIWLSFTHQPTPGQLYLLGSVGAFSIFGFIFVSLYISCKPSLTEYFARADELFNEADNCGIYYEFCSRIFKMPDLSKDSFKRLTNQAEIYVEETYIVDK